MYRFLMVFICCSLLIGFVPQAAEANSTLSRLSSNESQSTTRTVYIDARDPKWKNTKVDIEAGDIVRIRATGRMSFGSVTGCDPDGNCTQRKLGEVLAGNMNKSGLIVEPSGAFAVGSSYTSESLTGRLYLGIGDSAYGDNSGGFNVTITVDKGSPGNNETVCHNYDMRSPYWHTVIVFWRALEVPVSDEIRVRYRACWNDDLVWQDGGPMQVVRASGGPVYKPSTQTVGARFGNGSHPLVLDSGVTLLYEPRPNATYKGASINADVTVTVEMTVRKGGCARLYLNNEPVRSERC